MFDSPIEILLVEDDAGDAELTREVLDDSKLRLNVTVVQDGVEALAYLRREGAHARAPRPDLILLDLNLPRMNGRELLEVLKGDENLRLIPVVILTTSKADEDILKVYALGGNCFVTKPVGLPQFARVVKSIDNFWFTVVKLPRPIAGACAA